MKISGSKLVKVIEKVIEKDKSKAIENFYNYLFKTK